ncbi:MAG: glycosyltransferase [Chloroflexi bacterium]|nr:glycosyltransferase [Chloroflexota bacterium]
MPESVTVVVVQFGGWEQLRICLRSLVEQEYPTGSYRILVVDNGSPDNSVRQLGVAFPAVEVLAAGTNLGFAAACDRAVESASTEWVAFLNNDARADRRWLAELVAAVETGHRVSCAGSLILDPAGRRVDFAGGAINFGGHGFQLDYGVAYNTAYHARARPIPFACGGAMLIERATFQRIGGFDADYFAFFEDVDLGWRLWLAGEEVVLAPRSIVYHWHHGTARRMPESQRRRLYERNALFTLFKNLGDDALGRALPAALTLTGARAAAEAPRRPADPFQRPGGRFGDGAVGGVQALADFAEALPRLRQKRDAVQAMRQRSDQELFARFPEGWLLPSRPGSAYAALHRRVADAFGVAGQWGQVATRVLVLTHERLSRNLAGPGVRALEIARALAAPSPPRVGEGVGGEVRFEEAVGGGVRFDVLLAGAGEPEIAVDGELRLAGFDRQRPETLVPLLNWCDMVFTFGYLLHEFPALVHLDKPVAVDIYDPFILENLEVHAGLPLQAQGDLHDRYLAILNAQLRHGDFYVCASERQRDFWLGMLAANGRLNPASYQRDRSFRHLIDVVPFGLPATPPARTGPGVKGVHPGISPDDRLVVWGGGIWQWLDPLTLLRAMERIASARPDVKLFFMGKAHRDPEVVPEMPRLAETIALARDLDLLDRSVFFNDWVPYAERANVLLDADVGVTLHPATIESHFAFRARILDYLWAGLPIVCTAGDPLAELVEREGIGVVVPPGDVPAVAAALLTLLGDDARRTACAANARRLAPRFLWTRLVEPLRTFLRDPVRAADRPAAVSVEPDVLEPTPAWRLPLKAARVLGREGLAGLRRELAQYIRWRRSR